MKQILLTLSGNLKYLGLDAALIIAGLAGGITFLSRSSQLTKWQKFMSVLSGGFSANYLTPVVGQWLGLSDNILYGIAFLLGYGGLKTIESIFVTFSKKINHETK